MQPTKATPGGCVVAFFGLFPLVVGAVLLWAMVKASQGDLGEVAGRSLIELGVSALVCLVLGVLLITVVYKLAIKADVSDPYSEKKPKMRF